MHAFAAALLEAAGPLTLLGAQALYVSQPVLRSFVPGKQIDALATMLDNPAETQQFVVFLRESSVP
jgi:copper(I)-binding protein